MKLDKFSEPNVLGSCTLTLDGTTVLVWEGPTCLLDIQFFTRFHGQRLDYTEHRQQGHKQRIQSFRHLKRQQSGAKIGFATANSF